MTMIARIIETDTIAIGDMIAFNMSAGEVAGIVRTMNDNGTFTASTVAFGLVEVEHDKITDIM
jgi:hypothetical protein